MVKKIYIWAFPLIMLLLILVPNLIVHPRETFAILRGILLALLFIVGLCYWFYCLDNRND